MPLEVLAIIEHVQKQLGKEFSPAKIKNGVLKDLITEADYDIITVVCTYCSKFEILEIQEVFHQMPEPQKIKQQKTDNYV